MVFRILLCSFIFCFFTSERLKHPNFIVFVLLGLKETAVVLADPFGGNDVDFETEVYMADMLANSKALISPSADYVPQTLPLAVVKASPTKK